MIGKRFGKLTVESFSHKNDKYRYLYWNCKCDCGSFTVVPTASLNRKKNPTESCGCLRKEKLLEKFDFNKLEFRTSNFNSLYHSYQKTSKDRELSFNIDKETFKKLTQQNCYYCNIEPTQIHQKKGTNGPYVYNGLDRINSNIGYEINNVVTCCKTCNYAKRDMTTYEFINWIKRVYYHTSLLKMT